MNRPEKIMWFPCVNFLPRTFIRVETKTQVAILLDWIISSQHDFHCSFTGCIDNIVYSSEKKLLEPTARFGNVSDNCDDICSEKSQKKCENGGRCLQYFTYTGCDCSRTGYQGEYCNAKGNKNIAQAYFMRYLFINSEIPLSNFLIF